MTGEATLDGRNVDEIYTTADLPAELRDLAQEDDFVAAALSSTIGFVVAKPDGEVIAINRRFEEISGYRAEEVAGVHTSIFRSAYHPDGFFISLFQTVKSGRIWKGDICNRHKNGSLYWVDATVIPYRDAATGVVTRYIGICLNVTEKKQIEADLHVQAQQLRRAQNVDAVTGLANRRALRLQLASWMRHPSRKLFSTSLMLVDICHFRSFEDINGLEAGNVLLRATAVRLRQFEGRYCVVAHIGAGEFALLFAVGTPENLAGIAESLLVSFDAPVMWGSRAFTCDIAVGYAMRPDHDETEETLFRHAGLALRAAGSRRGRKVQQYTPEVAQAVLGRVEQIDAVDRALAAGEFALHYQPVVSRHAAAPFLVEALLRWHHPARGILTPDAFPEALDDPDTAASISRFVLERTIGDLAAMVAQGLPIQHAAINVSAEDFLSSSMPNSLADRLDDLLARHGLPPGKICIEVRESVILDATCSTVSEDLRELHRRGYKIALDDFGTGFASLTHLLTIPLDYVKIDRSFVSEIDLNGAKATIVRGLINVVHGLDRRIIAEGVETQEQATWLRALGCDAQQGWYYGRAVPLEQLADLFRAIRSG